MSFIKRLLSPDFDDEPQDGNYSQYLPRKDRLYTDTPDSDNPILADQSWSELLSDLLSTDLSTGDAAFHGEGNEAAVFSFHHTQESVESGIELWAEQKLLQLPQEFVTCPLVSLEAPIDATDLSVSLVDHELLCYGMIHQVAVRVGGDMLEVDAKLKAANQTLNNDSYIFSLGRSSDQVDIRFQDGTKFGIINTHVSKGLNNLIDRPYIHFDAVGALLTFRDNISRATKARDAVVRININIYGPREASKDIGSHLSGHIIYLQRPDQQRPGSIYENPHVLKFAGIELPSGEQNLEVGTRSKPTSGSREQFQNTISNVYASLTRGSKLNRVKGDDHLRTKLLPHQQEALDFMEQRETGPIHPDFCLWKPMGGGNEGWFCHAVTGARSRIQGSEIGGGILADEMGMGKSLSILSLVMKTVDSSLEWASSRNLADSQADDRRNKACRATLVIVPSAILINEWLNEISVHLDGTLKAVKYHGNKRKALVPTMNEVDIVLTTYHTLVADFGGKPSPLHEFEWFRVVLDEGHMIRRQATTFYRSVSELRSRSRWCLTGTPIQNRLEDVGSLFAFLRVSPFHSMATFRRYVSIPFDESEERREVATRNLTLLLDSLCLRRSRDLLHLPEPQNIIRIIEFSDEERMQYEQTKKIMNRALRQRVGESYTKSIFGMFQIQLQLRILCNHGTYQHSFSWTKRSLQDEREDALCMVGNRSEVNCSACRQLMPMLGSSNTYQARTKNCAHVLCSECIYDNEQIAGEEGGGIFECPLCAISGAPSATPEPSGIDGNPTEPYLRQQGESSKMNALIADIRQDLSKTKSIVFSCWTNTLNLIERYLREENISFSRIDGNCPLRRRQKILDDFSATSTTRVLIMTTGTGAIGLNLTSANRVFLIEPQWNPSVENQAISRAIRLKQTDSVLVVRYIVKGTVEQDMRSQQERKLRIADIGNGTPTQQSNTMA